MQVSVEDFITVQNLIGRYQWAVDDGDSEAWADLFLEDGALIGAATEPLHGHVELKKVPAWVNESWQGGLRHLTGSLTMAYGAIQDEMIARYYNLVTVWNGEEPQLFTMAVSEMHLVRCPDGWKIKTNNVRNLATTRAIGDVE